MKCVCPSEVCVCVCGGGAILKWYLVSGGCAYFIFLGYKFKKAFMNSIFFTSSVNT